MYLAITISEKKTTGINKSANTLFANFFFLDWSDKSHYNQALRIFR